MANGWGRETFALTIALQNLIWGAFQPVTGALADRYGAFKIMVAGGVLYALGLAGMAISTDVMNFTLAGGLMIGLAQTATTYSVIYGILGRNVSADKRVWAMGIAAAAGSFGQFLMIPAEQGLLTSYGAQDALLLLALMAGLMIPIAFMLREKNFTHNHQLGDQTIKEALKEAIHNPSFRYLTLGYFVCGFHTAFITLHLPAFVVDKGLNASTGAFAIGLIGLFNVFGSFTAGKLGGTHSKKNLLAGLYALRAVGLIWILVMPTSPWVVYVFAAWMGVFWLGTVPLTQGLIGQIYGLRFAATLSGMVFLGHQLGSFTGVWLGGRVQAVTGSYDLVWWIGILLALMAAALCLPVRESPISVQELAKAG
jgi:MFS family permease